MEQVMPGQAGAPLGLTLTLVDPMLAAKCCASFEWIARRRHLREKSTIDHLADKVYAAKPAAKD